MDAPIGYFAGRDGARLAFRELGRGPTVVLWHGFLAAGRHWLESGAAGRLAAAGYRVVLLDLRGHGDSVQSHDPRAYTLGGRVALRVLTRGARPQRVIVGGQELAAVTEPPSRHSSMRRALEMIVEQRAPEPDSPEADIVHWSGAGRHHGRFPRR